MFDLNDTWRTGLDVQRVSDQSYLLQFGFGNPLLNAEISRGYLEGFDRARRRPTSTPMRFSRCCPGSATRPSRSCCRWSTATGRASPTRSADAGTSTPTFSTSSARSARRPGACRSARNGTAASATASAASTCFPRSLRGDGYSVNNLSPVSNPDLPSAYFPVERSAGGRADRHQFRHRPRLPAGRAQMELSADPPRPDPDPADRADRRRSMPGPMAATSARSRTRTACRSTIDDTDLFRPDRLAGYDMLDTGQRVDYGIKLGLYDSARRQLSDAGRAKLPGRDQSVSAAGLGRRKAAFRRRRAGRAVAELLSRPDLSLPPRRQRLWAIASSRSGSAPGRRICGSAPTTF